MTSSTDAHPAGEPAPDLQDGAGESIADARARGGRLWLVGLAIVVGLASLLGRIAASGIWDPPEMEVAELARRIALTLMGGVDLAIEGAKNTVPTQGELGRGQLPFQSVALGFRLFGLHEWAGRLPLALWGLLGLSATFALVARLADRATAALAVLVLATTPLYFLQARTILGDIVTMACVASATAGLALAVFDESRAPRSTARRVVWFGVGVAALAGGGFGARGLLVGVAVPSLGVGLAWVVGRAAAERSGDRLGSVFGGAVLSIGIASAVIGFRAMLAASPAHYSMLLGATVEVKRQLPTHDSVIHHLGHSLYPWSAVLPFAIGRMLRSPPSSLSSAEFRRESSLRLTLGLVAAVGLAIQGAMAPKVGHIPFGPVFALAGIVAVAMRDFERGAPGSRALAMGVCAFAVLLYMDFKNFPEKGLSAFGVEGAKFPDSFKEQATEIVKYGTLAFSGFFFFSVMERQRDVDGHWFHREDLLRWPRALKKAFHGNLMFAFLVITAALGGFSFLRYLSDNWFHWKQFESMGALAAEVSKYWYAFPLGVLLVAPLAILARDVFRVLYRYVPLTRGCGATLAPVAFGAVLSLGYYPALAAQISPRDVFVAYRDRARPGEPLAMLGAGAGSARYYAGREVPTHSSVNAAFNWLMEDPAERRWLVIRSKDFPQMNSLYRAKSQPRRNLPVLDARSSEILLVSNLLRAAERNQNPVLAWFPERRPAPAHRTDANFGNQLDSLGWEVTDLRGRVVEAVEPGVRYQFRIYYEVTAKISGNWETFIHIDGFQRRFNGDHKTLEGKYPFHLWLPGDHVVDIHTFALEPNFTPGNYRVFYGLFIGSRRLEVKRGKHSDNRLDVGTLRVK